MDKSKSYATDKNTSTSHAAINMSFNVMKPGFVLFTDMSIYYFTYMYSVKIQQRQKLWGMGVRAPWIEIAANQIRCRLI